MYSAPVAMGHFPKTELNVTHFYTTPKFSLALWKDLAKLFQKQLEVSKKKLFGEVMRGSGGGYMSPEDPIYLYLMGLSYVRIYEVIKIHTYTSSYM